MTNIFQVYEFINFVTDKVRNGYLSPEEVSMALDFGQQALFQHYYVPTFGQDNPTTDALRTFETIASTQTASATGFFPYPSDYKHIRGIHLLEGEDIVTTAEIVLQSELAYVLKSALFPLDKIQYTRYMHVAGGVQFYPKKTFDFDFHYLRGPSTPIIGYTVSGNTIVYDPSSSVELDFPNSYWIQIVQQALPFIGVNLSSQEVTSLIQTFNPDK